VKGGIGNGADTAKPYLSYTKSTQNPQSF